MPNVILLYSIYIHFEINKTIIDKLLKDKMPKKFKNKFLGLNSKIWENKKSFVFEYFKYQLSEFDDFLEDFDDLAEWGERGDWGWEDFWEAGLGLLVDFFEDFCSEEFEDLREDFWSLDLSSEESF